MRKQWVFPNEFRIAAARPNGALRQDLERLLETLTDLSKRPGSAADGKLLVQIANNVWRLRRSMVPYDGTPLLSAEPLEGSRKAFRWLVCIWELLEANQIKIIDHTGEGYRSGKMVIPEFEPSSTVLKETIIDTIKPTIYHQDQLVQTGEVLVGVPEANEI